MVGVILLPGWVQCHPNAGDPWELSGCSGPPISALPRMPPNTRAGPRSVPKPHFSLVELLGLAPLPSGAGWAHSAQPHPVHRQGRGVFHVPAGCATSPLCTTSPPKKLGLWAEPAGQQTVKHRAWPCALCDTLAMCPGSAKAGGRR